MARFSALRHGADAKNVDSSGVRVGGLEGNTGGAQPLHRPATAGKSLQNKALDEKPVAEFRSRCLRAARWANPPYLPFFFSSPTRIPEAPKCSTRNMRSSPKTTTFSRGINIWTCSRVLPIPGVKLLLVRRGNGLCGQTQNRIERVHRIEAAVESEDVLVQVCLQLLRLHATQGVCPKGMIWSLSGPIEARYTRLCGGYVGFTDLACLFIIVTAAGGRCKAKVSRCEACEP
jgi:hypothetical protein